MKNDKTPINVSTGAALKMRIWVVAGLFVFIGFGILAYNLFVLQVVDTQTYQTKAAEQQLGDTIIPPNRGDIYDTNMKVLAKSSTVWDVSVSPNTIEPSKAEITAAGDYDLALERKVDLTAQVLADVLELEKDIVLEKIKDTSVQYIIIKKKIEKDMADELQKQAIEKGVNSIHLAPNSKRSYPYGDLAPYILGFVGGDNQGLNGIEAYYDAELTGTPGRIVTAQNAKGYSMDYEYATKYPAIEGNSLVLTVDETIQQILERELDRAVQTHNVAEKGMGMVMDVNTGAILALAVMPGFDPNDPYTIVDEDVAAQISAMPEGDARTALQSDARQEQWRNKIVSDIYEPGSVFKVITAAAAIDSGTCTVHSPFLCTGSISPAAGVTMRCANNKVHGQLTLSTAIMQSCNNAFVKMNTAVGEDIFYDYFNAFGFTEKSGIDLPGEGSSIFYTPEGMGPVELASVSFGQSNKISSLQMISAFAAAVNGGNLVQPHLVSKIIDPNGNIIESIEPEPKRQVISESVSQDLRGILEENVGGIGGQASRAYVPGYRVGGKSGTSQKLDKKDEETGELITDAQMASFSGFAPANDPEIVVLVVLDEPDSYNQYGGVLVAPVVANIIADVMPYLGVETQYTPEELSQVENLVPDCLSAKFNITANAEKELMARGFDINVKGTGANVVSQFPPSGTLLPKGSTVILYTEAGEQDMVKVPDVSGKQVSVVENWLDGINLNIKSEGPAHDEAQVVAVSQSIEAGTMVPEGTLVVVNFEDKSITYG